MKRKYISYIELVEELHKCESLITSLEDDVLYEKKRQDNLNLLTNYMFKEDINFIERKHIKDKQSLQHYILPIKALEVARQNCPEIIMCGKRKRLNAFNVGEVLEDFVSFICQEKDHKIGVGDYLIQKYLDEREFY